MSVWTDIRDTITAPFRAGYEILTAPVDLAWSLAHGEGFTDAIKDQIHDIGNPAVQTLMPFVSTETGQGILKNETLNKLTLGLSGDYAGYVHGASTLADSQSISHDDILSTVRLGAKVGAIVGTAGLASMAGVGTGTVVSGIGVAGNLAKGDLSGVTNYLGLPDMGELAAPAAAINNYFQPDHTPHDSPAPAPTLSEQAATSSGYRAPASVPSGSSSTLLLAGLAVGGILLLKKAKH